MAGGRVLGFGGQLGRDLTAHLNRAALVVSQTRQVHEDIAQLLADLRATRNLQAERQGSAKSTHAELPQAEPKPAVEATKPATTSSILPPAEMKAVSSAVRRQMASANNQFACDLYARVAKQAGNVAFSPLCINMAMGMANAGAKGETADEIAKALHFSAKQHDLHDALAAMRQGLAARRSGRGVLLKFANRFWPKEGHGFEPEFTELLRTKYAADVRPIDVHQPEAAAEAINQWFSMQTIGDFPPLVRADFINDDTALVLTSAVSFHGTWETPFHVSATKPQQFLGFKGKNELPMMNQLDELARFAKVGDVQLLEKRYADSTLAMTILLTEKGTDAFSNLTSRLTSEQLAAWLRQLETRSVRIAMPKFRLVAGLPLKECLEDLGVKRAFQSPGGDASADLSGMDGTGQLYFSDALHQAVVEVDEVGTKASAGTAFGGFGGMRERPVEFRADHPFVFVIRDTRTGFILFMGHFKRPTGSLG